MTPERPPFRWVAAMARRDARRSWRRLLVYLSATSIGIAALVAAGAFRANLQSAIALQARPLLGADLVVRTNQPFSPGALQHFNTLPFPRAREVRVTTMAQFTGEAAPRLIEARAVENGFPYYGDVKTEPAGAIAAIFTERAVLLEDSVIAEQGLKIGDPVEIGEASFRLAGSLLLVPGEAMASVFTAPRAYIDHAQLTATGLVKKESLARHRIYFKIPDGPALENTAAAMKEVGDREGFRSQTVTDRERSLGRQAENAERFLSLAALAMLLLGGVGVASIMRAYVRDKWATAATLRCLGAPARETLLVFVLQAAALGLIGALAGASLGVLFQAMLPRIIARFVSISIPFFIAWTPVLQGFAAGFAMSFLFSLLPLLGFRHVPPLAAFRFGLGVERSPARDKAVWVGGAVIAGLLVVIARSGMPNLWSAALLPVGVGGVLLLLALVTKVALTWLQRHVRPSLPHVWRHGLANLFRPNNQTFLLVPTLGLGAALLFFITFAHRSLIGHLTFSTAADQANLALIDVQADQRGAVAAALKELGAPLAEEAPIVSMRISQIKDQTVETIRKGETDMPGWTLNRVYRSTYRNALTAGERITDGAWPPAPGWTPERVPVAMEEDIADDLGVGVGDTMTFDIQGVEVPVVVAALRAVDWYQMRPNFFFVFPEGSLDGAPQFFVTLTRAATTAEAAAIQRRVRREFPNVSTMDLRMALATLTDYLGKISWLLRFMLGFVVLTGLLVLAGALLSTRFDRLVESALLRTLGASRATIRGIHLIEYGLTGFFSGAAGLAIGLAAGALTTRYLFNVPFNPGLGASVTGLALITALTMATGLSLGRGFLRHSPLDVLREER